MGGDQPAAPAQPDPITTSSAQGAANVAVASAQNQMNNINQVTPYGSLTYYDTGTRSVTQPDGTVSNFPVYESVQSLNPQQQHLLDQQTGIASDFNDAAYKEINNVSSALDNPVTNDSLQPLVTSLNTPTLATGYDQGGSIQTGYGSGGQIQNTYGSGGSIQSDVDWTKAPTQFGQTQSSIQSSVPVQQAATTFGATKAGPQYFQAQDFTAARDAATNAALQRLAPSMAQQQEAMNAQLANQGLVQGSAAWNAAQLSQAQANNDLRLGAVATGDAEQQALFGEQATANQLYNAAQNQDYTQQQGRGLFALGATQANNAANLAAGQFHNAAQQQDFGQLLDRANYAQSGIAANNAAAFSAGQFHNAAQAQGETELAARAAFGNSAQAQAEGENAARAAFSNQAQAQQNGQNQQAAAFSNQALQQGFGDQQAAATFANQSREQDLQDQETINNNTINQASALMHGGQVTTSSYQGYTPAQIGETPVSQDTYASANLAEQAYQAQLQAQAQSNSAMWSGIGGLFSLGGKMMGISDRRTKRDIVAFGPITGGLPVYAFRYAWDADDAPLTLGHMADEVAAVAPHAVLRHPSGFDMVDYGAL